MSNNPKENPPKFDTEALLRDILAVLQKHNIPIQSAALDISMLDADFDEQIPHLQTYKAGIFHRAMLIDGLPMLLDAKRRIPFEDIVNWLEENIAPSLQAASDEFKQAYPQYSIKFTKTRGYQGIVRYHDTYLLLIDLTLDENLREDYNVLQLAVSITQRDMTSYPTISSSIGWLVDEESGDDWGLDVVYSQYPWDTDVAEHHLERLKKTLPEYFRQFKMAIEKRIKESD